MNRNWLIFYKGVLAGRKLTRNGANAYAYELLKAKNWKTEDVEVRDEMEVKNERTN